MSTKASSTEHNLPTRVGALTCHKYIILYAQKVLSILHGETTSKIGQDFLDKHYNASYMSLFELVSFSIVAKSSIVDPIFGEFQIQGSVPRTRDDIQIL